MTTWLRAFRTALRNPVARPARSPRQAVLGLTALEDRSVPSTVWSQRGGNAGHTGYVDVAVDAAAITPVWTQTIGYASTGYWDQNGNRAVAIDGDRVYRTELEGYWATGNYHIMAFDLQTGAPVWNQVIVGNGPVSAPSFADGAVYVNRSGHSGISGGSESDRPWLYRLDAATGATLGRTTYAAQWGSDERPTIEGGLLVSENGYYGGMGAWSIPGLTGQWAVPGSQYALPGAAMDANFIYAYGDSISSQMNTTVHSRTTGVVVATLTHPTGMYTGSPVVAETGKLLLTVSGIVNGVQQHGVAAYDAATRAVLWTAYTSGPVTGKAVGHGVVAVTAGGRVTFFDEATGAERGSWQPTLPLGGYLSDDIVLTRTHAFVQVDGYLYGPSTVYAVNLATGQSEWSFTSSLTDDTNYSKMEVAAVDGTLVISHDKFVKAFHLAGPANRPPVAADDTVPATEDTAITVPASSNDTDPDGDAITVTAVGSPAHGSAVLDASGTITYTPAADYSGSDSFTYTISDGRGGTATATVRIAVAPVNDAPRATAAGVTVNEDSGPFVLSGYAVLSPGGGADEAGQSVTPGTATNNNAALFAAAPVLAADGTLTFTPAPNAFGTATVTVPLTDSDGATGSVTFTITVTAVNDAPTFVVGADQTVAAGSGPHAVSGFATGFTAGPANEAPQTVAVYVVSTTNPALFSVQPAVAANGTLTFTPALNAIGTATVTVRVRDSGGAANGGTDTSAPQTFTITITAPAPIPLPPPNPAPSPTTQAGTVTAQFIALGTEAGTLGTVRVLDAATRTPIRDLVPFAGFGGGVRVALGDVNGDGRDDLIVSTSTGNAHVKVFDVATGTELQSFLAFPGFGGGVDVAAADVDGDGAADLIVGTATGNSHVKVFSGATGAELRSFLAFPGFLGGVRVAGGDTNGDGAADVAVLPGPGGNGHVKVFDGRSGALVVSFLGYVGYSGEITVAAGDADGDGRADVVTVAQQPTGAIHLKAFNARGAEVSSFFAPVPVGTVSTAPPLGTAPRVAAADVDGDRIADYLIGRQPAAGVSTLLVVSGATKNAIDHRFAFDPLFALGIDVA